MEPIEWRRVRLALGLRQGDMGELLGLSMSSIRRVDAGRQHPGRRAYLRLAYYLSLPGARSRLRRAGVRHPFDADHSPALAVWRRAARGNPAGPARRCPVCLVPLGLHLRCDQCTELLGPGHDFPASSDRLCGPCRTAVAPARRGLYPGANDPLTASKIAGRSMPPAAGGV